MTVKAFLRLSASMAALGLSTHAGALQQTRSISQNSSAKAAQQHPEVVAQFGGELTGRAADYVRSVARRVAGQTNIAGGGEAFHITTLNSPVTNAFAVPGGYLYVTRELLTLANDEAELASVLGHEAGHIAARHASERQRSSIISQILAAGVGLVTGSDLLGQLAGTVGQGVVLKYSRTQEYEADDLGVRYIAAAGYDPLASASFLNSLGAQTALEAKAAGRSDERATPSWSRTHPLSAARVTRATQKAQATGRAGTGLRNRDQYLAAIDGLIVGDDPKQGVIEGRNFLHPDLRLRFSVPQGYGIQNGVKSVSISGQSGQALFSGGAFDGNLDSYIASTFRSIVGAQASVRYTEPRPVDINGMRAAYSTARVATQQGQVDLTIVAYAWDSNTAYHFALLTQAGAGFGPFGQMVQSLTGMSAAEAAAVKPRVIDIVAVRPADTPASLSTRMAYDDYKLERFLVINGLTATSRLTPGQKIKLVVYGSR